MALAHTCDSGSEVGDVVELLVIADDLTGALDSGVRLAERGARVVVTCDWQRVERRGVGADVLVVDTESRHLPAVEAYRRVYDVASKAPLVGASRVYKKCDSGLRGNVGAELAAALDAVASGRLNFVPAYPALGRTTVGGVHFVDGVPLAKSVFASDPIDAMTKSFVADIVHEGSDVLVTSASGATEDTTGIVVYDCATEGELARIGAELAASGGLALAAGSAGLLGTYELRGHGTAHGGMGTLPHLDRKLVVVSGSVNGVCRTQLDRAEAAGSARVPLPLAPVLTQTWGDDELREFVTQVKVVAAEADVMIVDSLGPSDWASIDHVESPSSLIARALGRVACELESQLGRTLMIIGGDTLMGFFDSRGVVSIEPVGEIEPGVVLARYQADGCCRPIITKSGAFGVPDLLQRIQEFLREHGGESTWH